MQKYRIIFDGVTYRVERLWFGILPVVEKKYVEYEETRDRESVPIEFDTFEEAMYHVKQKLGVIPKPKREWKVVWRGYHRV
jgi:hypothetical protein